ncbi:MAG: restriction endonuclease subunit S [archaeon]
MQQTTLQKKLPEGWKWVKFNEVAEMKGRIGWRGLNTSDYTSSGPILLSVYNITDDFKLDLSKATHITQKSYDESPEIMLRDGDLLLSKSGTIGRTCVVDKVTHPMTVNAAINVVRTKPAVLNRYLMYFFASSLGQKIFSVLAQGMAQKNMFQRDLNVMPILLPPLVKQKEIVTTIDSQLFLINKIKNNAEIQDTSVNHLFNSFLKNLFENDDFKIYPQVRLKDVSTKIGSGITPRGGHTIYIKSGIALIRSMNVLLNEFKEDGLAHISNEIDETMKTTRVMKNDVLLNITGASIGRVCVVPESILPANVNQHVCIIRTVERLNPNYLSYYLSNPNFQKFIMSSESGATRQALTKEKIEKFLIPLPSRDIQDKIVQNLNKKRTKIIELREIIEDNNRGINQMPFSYLNNLFGQYELQGDAFK